MARLTSLKGRCFFCKKETENLVGKPDEHIPPGWRIVMHIFPEGATEKVLCCPECFAAQSSDMGFRYGVPF